MGDYPDWQVTTGGGDRLVARVNAIAAVEILIAAPGATKRIVLFAAYLTTSGSGAGVPGTATLNEQTAAGGQVRGLAQVSIPANTFAYCPLDFAGLGLGAGNRVVLDGTGVGINWGAQAVYSVVDTG